MNILTKVPKKRCRFCFAKGLERLKLQRSWLVNQGPHGSGTPRYEIKPNHKALSEQLWLITPLFVMGVPEPWGPRLTSHDFRYQRSTYTHILLLMQQIFAKHHYIYIPSLPKPFKYLVRSSLEPLKGYSHGIWKTRVYNLYINSSADNAKTTHRKPGFFPQKRGPLKAQDFPRRCGRAALGAFQKNANSCGFFLGRNYREGEGEL